VIRSQPAAKLVVTDAKSGAVLLSLPMAGTGGAWGAATASDGSVYVGGEKLFRYVPGQKKIEDLGRPFPEETELWDIVAGKAGAVYGGTFPGCRAFRYTPEKGFEDVAAGAVVPGEQYARSMAYAADTDSL